MPCWQAKQAERHSKACLPQKGGTRVAAAELARGAAGCADPVARALLAARPALQHLLFSMEANNIHVSHVRVLLATAGSQHCGQGLLPLGRGGWGQGLGVRNKSWGRGARRGQQASGCC